MKIFFRLGVVLLLVTGCSACQDTMFSMFGKNGYSLLDLGDNSRFIVFNEGERRDMIVVDARVSKYVLQGDFLFVARQPVVPTVSRERGTELALAGTCEYLKIDTRLRTISSFDPQELKWSGCGYQ